MKRAVVVVLALSVVGCADELALPWELDHDRIVAVRATPPSIVTGERAELDALIALEGATTREQVPEAATVVYPAGLASALSFDGGKWVVTAPDEATIEAARGELAIEAGEPVPLQVSVQYGAGKLVATKTVWLGRSAGNPSLTAMMIDGGSAESQAEVVVGARVKVPLSVAATEDDEVNWLTSCGTMHDYDLPEAYLRVEDDDRTEGELAVVIRDRRGGVAWRVWPIRAE